jgi:hypothetical protein
MHFAAGNVQRRMMPANRLLVWAVQKAVDLAIGIVIQLDLPHAELVGRAFSRPLSYLLDGLRRELRSSWKSMNLGISFFLISLSALASHLIITFHQSPDGPDRGSNAECRYALTCRWVVASGYIEQTRAYDQPERHLRTRFCESG